VAPTGSITLSTALQYTLCQHFHRTPISQEMRPGCALKTAK